MTTASAIGIKPAEFWRLTITEFFCAIDGWNKAQSGDSKKPLSPDRMAELRSQYGAPSGSIKESANGSG